MRVSRLREDTQLREVPQPQPGPGQVLIAVEAAGVCGSDLKVHGRELGPDSRVRPPVVLGHEGAGRVVALGEGVHDLEFGRAVVAETTYSVCGRCQFCKRGELNLCPERKGLGSGADGFFAPYTVVRRESVHALPEGASTLVGAVTEPLACAAHAVLERARVSLGETVVIFGPGPMGLMTALVASATGARSLLVGTAHSRPRLEFAEQWGLAETFDVRAPDFLDSITRCLGPGADAVFECTGKLAAVEMGLTLLRAGGRLVVLGEIDEPLLLDIQTALLYRELVLTGSKSSVPSSWRKALQLLPRAAQTVEAMVSHRLSLSRWQEAFELVRKREGLKVVLMPDG
jgi:L-iditol 2-dehydrogenase